MGAFLAVSSSSFSGSSGLVSAGGVFASMSILIGGSGGSFTPQAGITIMAKTRSKGRYVIVVFNRYNQPYDDRQNKGFLKRIWEIPFDINDPF